MELPESGLRLSSKFDSNVEIDGARDSGCMPAAMLDRSLYCHVVALRCLANYSTPLFRGIFETVLSRGLLFVVRS